MTSGDLLSTEQKKKKKEKSCSNFKPESSWDVRPKDFSAVRYSVVVTQLSPIHGC